MVHDIRASRGLWLHFIASLPCHYQRGILVLCLKKDSWKIHLEFNAQVSNPNIGGVGGIRTIFSDNWKGFCWVAAPETIIIRVLPLLDYNREYNIYCCTNSPRLAQAPQSDSNCGRRTNVLVIIKIILCKCLPGSWLIFIIELLSSFNRRGFSHQRFHSDALISFDSQSDLCLGSSLPIWILMLSHHLDYH